MVFLAAASLLRVLALPFSLVVDPFASTPAVTVSANGQVAAVMTRPRFIGPAGIFRWAEDGSFARFTPLKVMTSPDARFTPTPGSPPADMLGIESVLAVRDSFLVNASASWSGAYSGTSFEVQRWANAGPVRWPLPACVKSGDSVDQHAYGADREGSVALTIDRTGSGSFQVMRDDNEQFAPYAFIVRGNTCRNLGRGIVHSVDGRWAAGYRGYLNGKLAPDILDGTSQKYVAVRWDGTHARELGPGDAIAINASGFTVGANAVPGMMGCNGFGNDGKIQMFCPATPHATAWDVTGRAIQLAPKSAKSVAYAVNDDDVAVGTLMDDHGRHFAFRWHKGTLQRLDDLPHPPGWRFESAYAIDSSGAISGAGTRNGIPKIFIWRPSN